MKVIANGVKVAIGNKLLPCTMDPFYSVVVMILFVVEDNFPYHNVPRSWNVLNKKPEMSEDRLQCC